MSKTAGATGAHDVGGEDSLMDLVIDKAEHAYALWEKEVHSLQLSLVKKRLFTVDEMRRAIEGLPAEAQDKMFYYEKWASAIACIMIERGVISQSDLESEMGSEQEAPQTARYKAGDVVRVRAEKAAVRWRRPHLRTPGYIHGVIGVVERECQGLFGDPEHMAYRHKAPPQPMYRVRFRQLDVWEGYQGSDGDTVDIEVYQPWLEPATQQELEAQHKASKERSRVFQPGSHARCDHTHPHTHSHTHSDAHNHTHTHDGESHTHEERHVVEQTAVDREGEGDSEHRRLPEALLRSLISKGVVTPNDIREGVEAMDSRGVSNAGARVVARAWVDEGFRQRLLKDASSAVAELGITASAYPTQPAAAGGLSGPAASAAAAGTASEQQLPVRHGTVLTVVENTPSVHNLVVCTLCSCYPVAVLGMSPAWYKSRAYRARAVRDPRGVLKEWGTDLPEGVAVRVHDSTADNRYLVLPLRPQGTDGWTEEQLQSLVTRDTLIGVTTCKKS